MYGQNFAFPNSASYAILLANLASRRSDIATSAARLFAAFFEFYESFYDDDSEAERPVFLGAEYDPRSENHGRWAPLQDAWERGSGDVMVVLNPAYPYHNATHNVSSSSFWWFRFELRRAQALLKHHAVASHPWRYLLDPCDYTQHFRDAVVVRVESDTSVQWEELRGRVESRIRFLPYMLESQGFDARLLCTRIDSSVATVYDSGFICCVKPRRGLEIDRGALDVAMAEFRYAVSRESQSARDSLVMSSGMSVNVYSIAMAELAQQGPAGLAVRGHAPM